MTFSAERTLPFSIEEISDVLLDVANLPTWLPAFSAIDPPVHRGEVDRVYRSRIRQLVRARITIAHIGSDHIAYAVAATEQAERGRWDFTATPSGTRVTHSFTHVGTLLLLMADSFTSTPDVRLASLERRLRAIADGTARDADNTAAPIDDEPD